MNFPTGEIATLVNAVCADADCRRTIRPQSNWAHGPLRCFRLAGWARNTMNEHRDRVDPSRVPKGPTKLFFNHKTLQPYSLTAGATPEQMANSPTQREMCFGIARQTIGSSIKPSARIATRWAGVCSRPKRVAPMEPTTLRC